MDSLIFVWIKESEFIRPDEQEDIVMDSEILYWSGWKCIIANNQLTCTTLNESGKKITYKVKNGIARKEEGFWEVRSIAGVAGESKLNGILVLYSFPSADASFRSSEFDNFMREHRLNAAYYINPNRKYVVANRHTNYNGVTIYTDGLQKDKKWDRWYVKASSEVYGANWVVKKDKYAILYTEMLDLGKLNIPKF